MRGVRFSRFFASFVVACFVAGRVLADEPPERLERFLAAMVDDRPHELKRLEVEIARYSNARFKEAPQQVRKFKAEYAAVKRGKIFHNPTFWATSPEIGKFGRFDPITGGSAKCAQVIGPYEAIIEVTVPFGPELLPKDRKSGDFLLRGMSTEKMADDKALNLPECMECSGNFSYETVSGGTRTLLVLEPFDLQAARTAYEQTGFAKQKAKAKKEVPADRARSED